MGYRFGSIQPVLELFEASTSLSATDISKKLGKSTVIIHKYLRHLVESGVLEKKGVPPHTKYQLRNTPGLHSQNTANPSNSLSKNSDTSKKISQIPSQEYPEIIIDYKSRKILDESFLKFTPTGEKLTGFQGMQVWCKERNLSFASKATEYVSIYTHLESIRNPCGAIDGTKYIKGIFPSSAIDTLLYMDQYTWMDFGRGKLAELAYFAKQSQNKILIQNTLQEVLPKIECILAHQKIDAIGIVPWSIERKNQLLGNLRQSLLAFGIPQIQIIKYSASGIIIPQKSLKSRDDRILNAQKSIYIHDVDLSKYQTVLLIDDFVGSGSTLNETAKKLKDSGVKTIIGCAFVGNTNLSYEVIREI